MTSSTSTVLGSLAVAFALAACAAPTDSDSETAPIAVTEDGVSTTASRVLPKPDFVAVAYSNHAGCRDDEHTFHYRFYLKNQGNAAGVVPMTKVHISVPWSDNDALLDYTTYVWSTSLAAGETKLIDIVIPYDIYPTTYQAVVQPDVADVVNELNDANNDLVKNTAFWSGLPQTGNCT